MTRGKARNRGLIAWKRLLLILLVIGFRAEGGVSPLVIPLQAEPGLSLATRLTFNGQEAWFMFDTGAGAHTLARWFVDAAGIERDDSLTEGVRARDATGQSVDIQVVPRQVGLLPNGRSLVLESSIVADFPPEFKELEVGGLLNPQLLATADQAVVLDLRTPELRIEPFDDALRRLDARFLTSDRIQLCTETDAPVPNLLFSVLVSAGDENNGWLQLDTGAGVTSVAASSLLVAGVESEPGGEVMGIAGKRRRYSVAHNLRLSFGDNRATVDAQIVDTTHGGCGPDGLLGRDALNHCALLLGPDSLAIACDPRADLSRRPKRG